MTAPRKDSQISDFRFWISDRKKVAVDAAVYYPFNPKSRRARRAMRRENLKPKIQL
jgi:hypothetical protein